MSPCIYISSRTNLFSDNPTQLHPVMICDNVTKSFPHNPQKRAPETCQRRMLSGDGNVFDIELTTDFRRFSEYWKIMVFHDMSSAATSS